MNQILTHKKSVKTVAFSKSKLKCSKSAYATVCNTIQKKPLIDSILNDDGGKLRKAIELDQARNQGLIYVLLYELLLGPYGNIRGGGKLKRIILKHEAALRDTKEKLAKETIRSSDASKNGESTFSDILPRFPRYGRVNTLKSSMADIVTELHQLMEKYNVTQTDIYLDAHVPDLLVLSPNCTLPWHELEMVQQGRMILQDKSSCFSALALMHGNQGSSTVSHQGDYIDACAAPGNKTSHLAALVHKSLKAGHCENAKEMQSRPCKIFALDRSSSRHSILKQRMMQLAPRVSDPQDNHTDQKSGKQTKTLFQLKYVPYTKIFCRSIPKTNSFAMSRPFSLIQVALGVALSMLPIAWLMEFIVMRKMPRTSLASDLLPIFSWWHSNMPCRSLKWIALYILRVLYTCKRTKMSSPWH
jgi:tRNA and rRNA cytosine-C5-methylases